jgi:hypothetical protein
MQTWLRLSLTLLATVAMYHLVGGPSTSPLRTSPFSQDPFSDLWFFELLGER